MAHAIFVAFLIMRFCSSYIEILLNVMYIYICVCKVGRYRNLPAGHDLLYILYKKTIEQHLFSKNFRLNYIKVQCILQVEL